MLARGTMVCYSVSSEDSPYEAGRNLGELNRVSTIFLTPLSSCQSVARTSTDGKPCLAIIVRLLHAMHPRLNLLRAAPFSLCPTKYRGKQQTRFTGPITNQQHGFAKYLTRRSQPEIS